MTKRILLLISDTGGGHRSAASAITAALDEIDRAALERVDEATQEARAAPFPDPAALTTQLWADGGSAWRN